MYPMVMFGKSLTLFHLFGFRVRVDASWLLLALLVTWSLAQGLFPHYLPGRSAGVYWILGGVGVLGLVVSIVLHEFSHSLVARRFGLPIGGISLFVFGGVAEMEDEPPGAKSEFFMALAGPVASLALAALFGWLVNAGAQLAWPETVVVLFFYLSYLNLVLAIFNLVPAYPLDGGRILRAILWGIGKNLNRATRIAAAIGQGFGIALIVLGAISVVSGYAVSGLWWILIGLFVRAAAEGSYGQLRLRESVKGIPVHSLMTARPITVSSSINLRTFYEDYVFRYHHRLFPVVENGRLLGCIHAKSSRQVDRSQWERNRVAEFMTPCAQENSVDTNEDAVHALRYMLKTGNSRLVVTDRGQLAGVLTFSDLVTARSLREGD